LVQSELFKQAEKGGWFTYAQNTASAPQDSDRCLVFVPQDVNADPYNLDFLEQVMSIPFLYTPGFIEEGDTLWFIQRTEGVVVAGDTTLLLPPYLGKHNHGVGVVKRTELGLTKHIWAYNELYRSCFSLEKIGSNCTNCTTRGVACFFALLPEVECPADLRALKQNQVTMLQITSFDDVTEVAAYLKKISAHTKWQFVSPKTATDLEFTSNHIAVVDLTMWDVATRKKEFSIRARGAAATRKALKLCESECALNTYCPRIEPPYCGAPARCQSLDPQCRSHFYGQLNPIAGPFSQAQLDDAANRFQQNLPRVARKKIELIAYNSGLVTKLMGKEMKMGKMDSRLARVIFFSTVQKHSPEWWSFSIDDTLLLCTTPYWVSGYYNTPSFSQPPRAMTDDEFYTYVEICQHSNFPNRGYSRPSNIYLTGVAWNPGTSNFHGETDYGYSLSFDCPKDVMKYTSEFPTSYIGTMRWKAEVEKQPPETSLDK